MDSAPDDWESADMGIEYGRWYANELWRVLLTTRDKQRKKRANLDGGNADELAPIQPAATARNRTIQPIATADLSLALRWTYWTCEENCRYECMIRNSRLRRKKGEGQVHYYGKWPFIRVLGVQEVFSSAFSLLNGLPYAILAVSWPSLDSGPHSYLCFGSPWYVLIAINTWLQSAIFHARESRLTEFLDYQGANLLLSYSLAISLAGNLHGRWSPRRVGWLVMLPVLAGWIAHVLYLSFVKFDYGRNMAVCVGLGIVSTLSQLVWWWRHRHKCTFAWKAAVSALGPYVVLPLELLDFPPVFGLLDAHSLWHLGTVPSSFLMCSYIRDSIGYAAHVASATTTKKDD